MAEPYVRQARGVFRGKVGSTDLKPGDLVYFDGTDWEKSNATNSSKPAVAIAINHVRSGEEASFCVGCILVDDDEPYTAGAVQYLSAATSGAFTATAPSTGGNLVQIVGYTLTKREVRLDISIATTVVS